MKRKVRSDLELESEQAIRKTAQLVSSCNVETLTMERFSLQVMSLTAVPSSNITAAPRKCQQMAAVSYRS